MLYLGVAAFAITAWTFFVMWAMSAEKAASTGAQSSTASFSPSCLVQLSLHLIH